MLPWSWLLLLVMVLGVSTAVASQHGSEGDSCASHTECAVGMYCTQGGECGLCHDDESQPCVMWGDSIDGSCEVCGDLANGNTDARTTTRTESRVATDSQLKQSARKQKSRRKRKHAAGKRATAGDAADIDVPFISVPGAFSEEEVDRLRRQAALVPAVHSNAGIQGKRNVGTKESVIQGLSRERFGWIYEKMRKLVHETNDAHWKFEHLGEVSDSVQIATYHASAGGKYEWHVDQNLWGASTHAPRILSVTVQLTPVAEDNATAGGRLFVGAGVPQLAKGTAVVFPSYTPHKVEQVHSGSREALVAFFEGSDSRFEDLAMRALTSSVLALPEQHKLRTLLGEAQVETGLHAEALETLTLAAIHDEQQQQQQQQQQQHRTWARDFHTLDMLGVALYLGGRLSEAEAAFAQARTVSPELATGHAKLGSTLMRQGRPQEAASCYGKAISMAKEAGEAPDSRFLYNKGTLHMQLGQTQEAEAMFVGAIAVDPGHVKAMGNLAAVFLAAKRHAEAVTLLDHALTELNNEGRRSRSDRLDVDGTTAAKDVAQGKLPADLAVALGGAHEAVAAEVASKNSGDGAASISASLHAAHRAYTRALQAHPSHVGARTQLTNLVRDKSPV